MQESRLFRIVYYLLDKGKSTAPELAEKFEVSVRTIYRDIDIISSMGIPIYATQGKGGGITLLDNFVLDKTLLSTREKEQILMALQGMIATEQNNADELLRKLGSLFQSKNTNWIEVDFSNWVKNNPGQDIFNLIKSAIFSRNVISFQYFGSNRESTQRRVEPLRLVENKTGTIKILTSCSGFPLNTLKCSRNIERTSRKLLIFKEKLKIKTTVPTINKIIDALFTNSPSCLTDMQHHFL